MKPLLAAVLMLFMMLCCASSEGHGQRILSVASALTSTQEPASTILQSMASAYGAPLPGGHRLSGVGLSGPISLLPPAPPAALGGHAFLMSHGWPPGPATPGLPFSSSLQAFKVSPFQTLGPPLWYGAPGWRAELVGVLPNTERDAGAWAVILETAQDAAERLFAGRLRVLDIGLGASEPVVTEQLMWELPGRPVAGELFPDTFRVAILCEGPAGALLATADIRDPEGAFTAVEALPEGAIMGARPSALRAFGEDRLVAFQSGYPPGARGGNPQTWLTLYDRTTLERIAPSITLNGVLDNNRASVVMAGERCWVATRLPGTYFAYVTEIRFGESPPEKIQEVVLNNVVASVHLAVTPEAERRLAVALDSRIEIWAAGRRGGDNGRAEFSAPVRGMAWGSDGLLVSEAGRIHAVDAESGAVEGTVQYQQGQIVDFVPVPETWLPGDDVDGDGLSWSEELRLGTDPEQPDSDGDEIHDGIDPAPMTFNPTLEPGARQIVFRGAAAGKELRAFRIGPDSPDTVWRVNWDTKAMPWLRLQPQTGRGAGVVYLGVDPLHLPKRGPTFGQFEVELQSLRPGIAAWGSPAFVPVFVTPAPDLPRRILWVWPTEDEGLRSANDPRSYKRLAELMVMRPHYFAHAEAIAPVLESITDYDIVVLPAAAAARGALTRKAILDYVSGGGALLVSASGTDKETMSVLSEWLRPMGIDVSAGAPAEPGAALAVAGLTEAWASLGPKPSCRFTVAGRDVSNGNQEGRACGFVLRRYGYGRVALLGDPTVLQSEALGDEANTFFAVGLMRWLARAGIEFNDLDGDGIPDEIEDLNGNGLHDPGETDFMHPDTDGDGVPDGLEDLNRNGKVDDGETDPRNPDADSDGIRDGADRSPAPIYGAPHIDSVAPSEAPLEGGETVVISGRNFLPGTQIWFGERNAPSVQMLGSGELSVVVPDGGEAPGTVAVRLKHPRQEIGARLPDAFRYLPRSAVRLRLSEGRVASTLNGRLTGVVGVQLLEEGNESIRSLQFTLRMKGVEGFRWGNARPGTAIVPVGRQVTSRSIDENEIHVLYRPPEGMARGSGDLVRVPWSLALDEDGAGAGAMIVEVVDAQALRLNDAQLEVQSTPLNIPL